MNPLCHRLVFSRRLGMLVAVAETASARGKAAGGTPRHRSRARARTQALPLGAVALAAAVLAAPAPAQTVRPPVVFASKLAAPKNNLPVAYGKTFGSDGRLLNATPRAFAYDPAKGSGSTDLSSTGAVKWTVDGKTATFDQGSQARVVINWDSFDIGAGYKVQFLQDKDPARYVSALNRIWSADPSVILGSLTADREVILLNANGVYFGRGAVVDTGRFVATANSIADSVFEKGLRNITDGSAVFGSPIHADAAVSVEDGAEIRSAAGGDVLLVAPRVVNQGRIVTPQGQTVLAAGDKVYLMSSSDPAQRGLIVAVDPILAADGRTPDASVGIVENAARGSTAVADSTGALVNRLNEIRAESGTVNLVGLTVRQSGQINATTAVKGANGAIWLQAMSSTTALGSDGVTTRGLKVEAGATARVANQLGTVEIGAGSLTAVTPSAGTTTQIDAEVFNASRIRVEGAAISLGAGAQVLAPAGRIEMLASSAAGDGANANNPLFNGGEGTGQADGSRIVIAPGAVISAAGVQGVEVDGARNQGAQRLFRIELADAAVQRSGPLYRSQVYFDLRDAGKVTAANVSGAAASVARTAAEKSAAGGSIRLLTDGALVLGDGATLDVSGGSVHYGAATLLNTVLSQDGRAITFSQAAGSRTVDSVSATPLATTAPAYTEGANGGSLTLSARQMALAGTLAGHTTVGERQRDGRSTAATAASLTLGLGSGSSHYLDRLALRSGYTPALDARLWADPAGADLGTLASLTNGLDFPLDRFAGSGFGTLNLRARAITQPEAGQIALGQGGVFSADAATVQLDGGISAPGGSISITTQASAAADASGEGDIHLSGRSRLDVAGLWTNDTAGATAGTVGTVAGDSIQVRGGTVRVQAGHSLQIDAGAVVDASAGARLSGSGTLTQGTAGSIALGSGRNAEQHAAFRIEGAVVSAYGFASGGTLTLDTPAITFGGRGEDGSLQGPVALLGSGGFGSIAIHALGDIRVASGTTLAPQLLNWQFGPAYRGAASGRMDSVAAPALLDERLVARQPVNLALSAARPLVRAAASEPLSDAGGSVIVERGAGIVLAPGATLALDATHSITVGASGGTADQVSLLQARGGTLNLAITGDRGDNKDGVGFVPDQAIWLGSGARLAVDGIAQLRADTGSTAAAMQFGADTTQATPTAQRQVGAVLGGGSIQLNAARGYVVAEAGARLSLDGTQAAVNYAGLTAAVQVAKAAGKLGIASPEGIVFEAEVSAQAPRDATGRALADGGQLSVALGRGGVHPVTDSTASTAAAYPTGARVLSVDTHDGVLAASGASAGSDLSTALGNGLARVRSGLLQSAGWSGLSLAAGDLLRLDTPLAMHLPLGVQLDAPAIAAAPGVQVAFSGGAMRVGDSTASRSVAAAYTDAAADTSADASTTLSLSAPSIDLYGNLALRGFSTVRFSATDEIRLSAATPIFGNLETLRRQLNFAGTLSLSAQQIYATSATQYTLNGQDGSQVVVRRPAGAGTTLPAAPLSAFGSLTVNATDIDQGGVLRQPFGRITLHAAGTLRLGDHSLTSVSGDAATLLYGETLNLANWQLPGSTGDAFFYLADSKAVSLTAARFDTAASATVSAAGGGTLLAREFFPGVGGSSDYYATPGVYAVLPDYAGTQSLSLDGGFSGIASYGRQIVITQAGSGLAPGRYTLLPAQYALLSGSLRSGAYLVSLAADQGKTVLRSPLGQDDGSVVVTGYLSSSGSTTVGTPGQRFVVEPAATYQARSDVRLTDVSTLLQSTASTNGTAVPALPRDAGQITLSATDATQGSAWRAALALQASGGRAGTLDVSASAVALVDDLAKAPDHALTVSAATLADSGAGSVLLGGTRRDIAAALQAITAAGGTPTAEDQACAPVCLDTRALSTTVDLGRQALVLEELVLAARNDLGLAAGTTLAAKASGTLGAHTLVSQGAGALLAVSANALSLPREAATPDGGNLSLGAGSSLGGASVSLDATGRSRLAADTQLKAGALSLAARHLVLGTPSAEADGSTVLNEQLLGALAGSADLSLRAYTAIDFAGAQNWSQRAGNGQAATVKQGLVLDAPLLRGVAGAGAGADSTAQVDITAQSLVLRNTSGKTLADADVAAVAATGPGTGSLLLQATPPLRYGQTGGLAIGPGAQTLAFDQASLRSTGDIVLQGTGSLGAQGDLLLGAARLTAATAADQTLTAAGALRVAGETGSRSLGERVGQGANVVLSGATLAQDGVIDLPGGQLALNATGGSADAATLRFGADSRTSVAGYSLQADNGQVSDGTAGRISASTQTGRIALLGTLDVGAALRGDGSRGEGDAGRIQLQAAGDGGALVLSGTRADGSAVSGQLLGQAGRSGTDLGGQLSVDVRQMASADALAGASAQGGFTGAWQLRVREGDVTLDRSLGAQRITLAADGGSLNLGARGGSVTLDARAPAGGVLQLAAGAELVLGDGVRLTAGATRTDATSAALSGGDVLLTTDLGRLRLASGTVVDATDAGGQGGRIVLRARRGEDGASVAVDALNTANLRAAEVDIEAVRVYENVYSIGTGTGRGDTLGQTAIRLDNAAFMARAASIGRDLGLGSADAGRVQLRAGVEVRSDGDLSIDGAWDLSRDRAGGDAGFLTLRAAGNLLVNASISDGFASAAPAAALNGNTRSWSLRLAAGADLAAALPTTVQPHTGADDETATISLAAGTLLRTGAGSLELVAGRDVQFQGGEAGTAQAYVAGRRLTTAENPQASLLAETGTLLTTGGGRLEISAGHDVTAPEATQLIGNWFWRSGQLASDGSGLYAANSQLSWWSQFDRFGQTVGAFGGGNLRVQAGTDIRNLQAFVPSIGWADSRDAASATLQVRGGGELTVDAGRDLLGGQFLIGGGVGRLSAGGTLGADSGNLNLRNPVLAMTDGQWRLAGRSGVAVASPYQANATAPSDGQGAAYRSGLSGYYYTWGSQAGLSAVSNAGGVSLQGLPGYEQAQALGLFVYTADDFKPFQVTVPNLRLLAAGGDLNLEQTGTVMFPSATGQLTLWTSGNLRLGTSGFAQLAMSGSKPADFGTAAAPVDLAAARSQVTLTLEDKLPLTSLHADDATPAQLHADQAVQIRGASLKSTDTTLLLPKAVQISAGTDITELSLRAQNLNASDQTSLSAGRNLQALQFGSIAVGGPGSVVIGAGSNVDLGASGGVNTTGNLNNASLPAAGASVSIRAASAGTLNLATLQASYLSDASADGSSGSVRAASYRQALLDHVRAQLKQPALGYDEAWALFQAFPATAQAAFGRQLLASEFNATYLSGSLPTAAQMTATLRAAFERDKAQVLAAGEAALATNTILRVPGVSANADVASAFASLPASARAGIATDQLVSAADPRYKLAVRRFLDALAPLGFDGIDIASSVASRLASLAGLKSGWQASAAASVGSTVAVLEALAATRPDDPLVLAYRQALADSGSARFQAYRDQALATELASAGGAAGQYGVSQLPMRMAFYEAGFAMADLAGVGAVIDQPAWTLAAPLMRYSGALDMTQSSVVTQRGGDIRLVNPGGAINVGLKEADAATKDTAKGVIAQGGGNIFGLARDDFQVNTQRVFIVGQGDMAIWSSLGDIDSGRGANTAVAAPPLTARRSADGVVFETPATTTGSGLGILEDASGRRSGTIGLYPAFGEILALDAFIRAPSVVLGSSVKGADNLQSASVSGAAAPVAAPALSVSAPASTSTEARQADASAAAAGGEQRPRNALLTVDLLGLGPAEGEAPAPAATEACSEEQRRAGRCNPPAAQAVPAASPAPATDKADKACAAPDRAAGRCK